jgi:hypothetical protein
MHLSRRASFEGQQQLRTRRSSWSFQESARHFRRLFPGGLANQQMYVFRHDYISDQMERMPAANFIQDFHEAVPGPNRSKQRSPSITTEGHEMQITLPVVPFERIAHPRKNPHP